MEQYVFCGYPSDHANGSVLHFSELFAINANSKQKSGAWSFLSYLLTQPCQENMKLRLPVNDSVLQTQLAGHLEDETITQHEIDMFYQMVDGLQAADYPTATVEQIIREELAPLFSRRSGRRRNGRGQIESRVQTYACRTVRLNIKSKKKGGIYMKKKKHCLPCPSRVYCVQYAAPRLCYGHWQ